MPILNRWMLGVDLVDCSSGGLLPQVAVPFDPGHQAVFAERIKKEAGVLTGGVGMITAKRLYVGVGIDFRLVIPPVECRANGTT